MSLQAVPVRIFQEKLHSVRTYHDVLRIFYGNHILTDDIIDSMMENNAQPYDTPYGTMVGFSPVRRPRLGDRDKEYFSTSFSTRNRGEGIPSDMLLHDSSSSSSVMSKNKGSMSDIMLSDESVPQRKDDNTRTSSNNHRTRNRRRKHRGKGRKRRKGRGRKRFKKGKVVLLFSLSLGLSFRWCAFISIFVSSLLIFVSLKNDYLFIIF